MDHDNLEEYADPAIYDCENAGFEPDGPFYLNRAQQLGGSVLEIGCGTGRITIPLAGNGIDITRLDITPGMLDRAKTKAQNLSIPWIEADARAFHLRTQFQLIFMAGGTFQHFLERIDQEAVLARVREHLTSIGYFVFSAIFAHPKLLLDVATKTDWFSYVNEQGQEVQVSGTEYYDQLRQAKHETAFRRWHDSEDQEVVRQAPLALRYFFPQEIEALLHYNGFVVRERYGDWSLSPLTHESKFMIYVCQKTD